MLGPPSNVPQTGRCPCSDWRATLTAVPFTSTIAFTTSARTCVVLLPVLPPGRYSTTATSSISTIASGWARRLISIVVLVGVATPR
jgi:hypothetical protein